jgi:hypothetical protein
MKHIAIIAQQLQYEGAHKLRIIILSTGTGIHENIVLRLYHFYFYFRWRLNWQEPGQRRMNSPVKNAVSYRLFEPRSDLDSKH